MSNFKQTETHTADKKLSKRAYYADYIYWDNKEILKNHWLLTDESLITGVSKEKPEGYTHIVRKGSGIFPGLINTHTHVPMTLFRGIADDIPLKEWLQKHIWPLENMWLDNEFVSTASSLAAVEMIRSGTVCINDMYFYPTSIGKSFAKAGLRAVLGMGVLDVSTKYAKDIDGYIGQASICMERFKDNDNVRIAISPHAVYTVRPEGYRKCVEFALKHDLSIHTHASETKVEVDESLARHGKTPIKLIHEAGALGPKTVLAHCVHLNEEDIELIGNSGTNVAHCIESNLKLASGFAPIKQLMDAGANVTIGTDGAASNNDTDMVAEMSVVAKLHKALNCDATALNAKTVLDMATVNAAKACRFPNTGTLKNGNFADFIIVNFDAPHMIPVYDAVANFIYSGKSSDITDVVVKGNTLMENGQLKTVDEEKIIFAAKQIADKIAAGR